jgi:hypothetical protein
LAGAAMLEVVDAFVPVPEPPPTGADVGVARSSVDVLKKETLRWASNAALGDGCANRFDSPWENRFFNREEASEEAVDSKDATSACKPPSSIARTASTADRRIRPAPCEKIESMEALIEPRITADRELGSNEASADRPVFAAFGSMLSRSVPSAAAPRSATGALSPIPLCCCWIQAALT